MILIQGFSMVDQASKLTGKTMDQPGKERLKETVKYPCIKGAKYVIEKHYEIGRASCRERVYVLV